MKPEIQITLIVSIAFVAVCLIAKSCNDRYSDNNARVGLKTGNGVFFIPETYQPQKK